MAFEMLLLFSLPALLQSLSTTSEEHYYPIQPEDQVQPFQSSGFPSDSSNSNSQSSSVEEMQDFPEAFPIFPYAAFLTTTTPPIFPKAPSLQDKWSDDNFAIFPYASFLTTSTTTEQPRRKMSNKGGETKRNPATMKPANVIHFLEKILKMKRESKLKTGNRNKSRPNQVVAARRPFKEGKKKLSGVKKKNKKEDFTKAGALQKLFDIAGDDWDLNKEDFSQSAFHCPKVHFFPKVNFFPKLHFFPKVHVTSRLYQGTCMISQSRNWILSRQA